MIPEGMFCEAGLRLSPESRISSLNCPTGLVSLATRYLPLLNSTRAPTMTAPVGSSTTPVTDEAAACPRADSAASTRQAATARLRFLKLTLGTAGEIGVIILELLHTGVRASMTQGMRQRKSCRPGLALRSVPS